jgi:hypothetical protein
MLMVSTYLPIVFANLPPIIRSHHVWTSLWVVSLFLLKPKIFLSKKMFLVLSYGMSMLLLLIILWPHIDEWNKKQIFSEFYQIAIAFSVISYFYISKDYYGLAIIVKWTLIFVFITSIMSIITSFINPMYARDLTAASAVTQESEKLEILSFKKYGGGGYGFASAIVCLIPILLYYFKNPGNGILEKKYMLGLTLILIFTLLRVQFFANILISLIIAFYAFFGSKKKGNSLLAIFIISLILLLIPIQFYSDILVSLGSLFSVESELYLKFNDMAIYIVSDNFTEMGTVAGSRASRFPLLWESFISNPFIGGKYWNIHLHWMNKLAVFGLLGTIPFIYILFYYTKKNYKRFDKDFAFFYLLSVLSIVALGTIKAIAGRELWYMVLIIIPGSYYLPLLKQPGNITLKRVD